MIFRHHPDSLIYLDDLCLPLAFWLEQEPTYTLSEGAIGREYIPEVKHILSDGSKQWGGDLPWTEGDRYLAQRASYQAAWSLANTTPTPAALPKWAALYDSLRGSDLFAKAFATSQTNALALLLATLNSNAPADDLGRLADFDFAIAVIRTGLAEDFTLEQVQRFNDLLVSCDFSLMVNDGSVAARKTVRVGN